MTDLRESVAGILDGVGRPDRAAIIRDTTPLHPEYATELDADERAELEALRRTVETIEEAVDTKRPDGKPATPAAKIKAIRAALELDA